MQKNSIQTELVSADYVVLLQKRIEETEDFLTELVAERDRIAFKLSEEGASLIATDGSKIIISESSYRKILEELVETEYPKVYEQIRNDQIADIQNRLIDFQPSLTIKALEDYLGKSEIDRVTTKITKGQPKVSVKFSKVE